MPSASRGGNSASSKLTVSYSAIEKNSSGSQGRITSPKMEFYSKSGWSDSTNNWRVRGGAVTDKSWGSRTVNGGTETFACTGQWVNLEFDDQVTESFIGECAGVSFYENDNNSSYYGPSLTVKYPYRTYAKPTGLGVTLTRVSDSQAQIAVTGRQPYSSEDRYGQYIDWQLQTDDGAFAGGGTVTPTEPLPGLSIAVNGLTVNRRYRVQVRARNRDATGDWVQSGYIFTTPAAPTSAAAAVSGANNVVTAVVAGAPWRTGIQVERSQDAAAFGTQVTQAGTSGAWTHTAVPRTSSWKYRVRSYVTFGATTLYSDWRETGLLLAAPDAPTIGRCYRLSDTQQTIVWTRAATWASANKPAANHEIQVQVGSDTATPVNLPSVAGSIAQAVHTGTAANQRYRWRVRATNSGGASDWSAWSGWVCTTPAAPTITSTVKAGVTTTTGWTNLAPYRSGTNVLYKAEGGGFVAEASLAAAAESYTDSDANPAETAQYGLQARVDLVPTDATTGTVTLLSARVDGPVVQLLHAPNPPLVALAPAGVADLQVTDLLVGVTHQPVDSTAQAACELRWKQASDTNWGAAVSLGLAVSHLIPAGTLANGATWQFQAHTRGEHADWSLWSEPVTIKGSGTPAAGITSPTDGGEIGTSRITAELSYYDPEATACSGWQLRLSDADLVEEWASPVLPGTLHLAPYEIPYTVTDNTSHTLAARARDGDGLWSQWTQALVTVSYDPPPAAVVTGVWEPDWAKVTLSIDIPIPGDGEATPVAVTVARLTDGRPVTLQTTALTPDAGAVSVVDPIPTIGATVTYLVTTVSGIPSSLTVEVPVATPPSAGWVIVNGGPNWETVARARGNVNLDEAGGDLAKEVVVYAGQTAATELSGDPLPVEYQLAGDVARDPALAGWYATADAWRQIRRLPAPLCLRDPDGLKMFVLLNPGSLRITKTAGSPMQQITAAFTEALHDE